MNDTPRNPGSGETSGQSAANPDIAALNDAGIATSPQIQARLAAIMFTARYHGVEMNIESLRLRPDEPAPSPPVLVEWLREAGLWARGVPMNFRQLMKVDDPAPIVLLLDDGGAAMVVGRNREKQLLLLRDPRGGAYDPVIAVDELRLKQVWSGGVLLVRASRSGVEGDPPVNMALLARLVWSDKLILRDIAISSITITILSLVPILLVMRTISSVLQYHSAATLDLIIVILFTVIIFEALLSWGRKMMEVILAAKLDSRLNLIIFDRLMALPIEFFERQRAGELTYKVQQVNRVREFLTGKLMNTFIDVMMLCILLPVTFYINATLAWTVLVAAALIAVIIAIFLRPLGAITGRIIMAESGKGSVLVESIQGIKTVKALALESSRSADWDRRVAEVAELQIELGQMANWPATLTMPLQRYCSYGAVTLGAYIALHSNSALDAGSVAGFMLLGGR
ncbi:ABC transporter transmembrane domain-containing protein, partial [Acidocella sp.]|uniref:ABC transporter transmembrane domain-containing protein n=1 Tax=Acidocella sp. TaxID=50710 RepID=UPI00261C5BFC